MFIGSNWCVEIATQDKQKFDEVNAEGTYNQRWWTRLINKVQSAIEEAN